MQFYILVAIFSCELNNFNDELVGRETKGEEGLHTSSNHRPQVLSLTANILGKIAVFLFRSFYSVFVATARPLK
jgi:hypothetical protein